MHSNPYKTKFIDVGMYFLEGSSMNQAMLAKYGI